MDIQQEPNHNQHHYHHHHYNSNNRIKPTPGSSTYTPSFQAYDCDNQGEITILVNNQVVATFPASDSPLNNIFTSTSPDISRYIVSGTNTITFNQNIYSSGIQNVQVTGPAEYC